MQFIIFHSGKKMYTYIIYNILSCKFDIIANISVIKLISTDSLRTQEINYDCPLIVVIRIARLYSL